MIKGIDKPRKNRLWLVIPLAIIVALVGAGIWYCLPYIEGDAEYEHLREIAYGGDEALVEQQQPVANDDPHMVRQIDWEALRAVNPDVIGWICVPNTLIDYPVVQDPVEDPGKYLRTTFEGRVSWPNNEGCIYLDCGNIEEGFSSLAPLVYGHYQLNNSMFTSFAENYDLNTLNSHNQVYIYTPEGTIHIELFAARRVNANSEKIRVDFLGEGDLNAWLDSKLAQADAVAYDPGEVDQLWTFCTCSYGTWRNQRTLTYGRTVEDARSVDQLDETDTVATEGE